MQKGLDHGWRSESRTHQDASLLCECKQDAVQALARAADQVDVSAGRTLIQEGDVNLVAYIVEAGEAEVVVRGEAVATIDAG